MTVETVLLGDGVAAMSLASVADQLPNHAITVVRPSGAPEPHDHMLGFWNTEGLDFAASGARASWSTWSIVTHETTAELSSDDHAYHVMHKLAYLDRCKAVATSHDVAFAIEADSTHADLVFDSRPPRASPNAMLQHFHGLEVEIDRPVFDDSTAILMDFRVDQSQGMHFMYLLPFSKTRALVESTIFSTQPMPAAYYVEAIHAYLMEHHHAKVTKVHHEEKGIIPMGTLSPHDPSIPGLGANAGAIRPASGYTFVFIQQQIKHAIEGLRHGKPLRFKRPHKGIDVWMDAVLLIVLKHWPHHGPSMFSRMASGLTGDEFIRFMSGQATWRLRLKVMMTMPKWPFIRGVSKLMFQRPRKVVA